MPGYGEGFLKGKPNWLLHGLIGVSLGIHLVIFMHIAGIYRSNALTYIELTLKDVSKPTVRSIPRPRHRSKEPLKPQDVKMLKVTKRPVPTFKPIKVEPAESNLPDGLVERISLPDIPATPGLNIAKWTPVKMEEIPGDYLTSNSYLEMVRLRIERNKEYPDRARIRHIEGSVTIRFVITPAGEVRSTEVVKTSRHRILDTAALKAVKDAAPFPKPPPHFFKGEIPLEITIVFELT